MEEGISVKDLENLSDDKKRNKDLEELKVLGGPFTNAEEVNLFMSKPMDEKSRNHRLYIEVCYAKRTCLHYPKNSPLFSLKKNYLNLDSTTYVAKHILVNLYVMLIWTRKTFKLQLIVFS